jgi:hypothetical protein
MSRNSPGVFFGIQPSGEQIKLLSRISVKGPAILSNSNSFRNFDFTAEVFFVTER